MNTAQSSEVRQFVPNTDIGTTNLVVGCGHLLRAAIVQVLGIRLKMRFEVLHATNVASFCYATLTG